MFWTIGKIANSTVKHGRRAGSIPPALVVKSDTNLGQSLPEEFLCFWCNSPKIFKEFVGVEEFRLIERLDCPLKDDIVR